MMEKRILVLFIGVLLIAGLLTVAPFSMSQTPQYPYDPGGMMGPGTMGPGGPYQSDGQRLTIDQAHEIVEDYLSQSGTSDLEATEIMEFDYNFYVVFTEKSTSIHAFEALIDPYTGDLYGEPGPNMMWNTKYSNMSGMMDSYDGEPTADIPVTPEKAQEVAQKFLDKNLPGYTVGEADTFYGYYTLHTIKDGQMEGMLSVNGYDSSIWYHNWHGSFIDMKEFGEH